MLVKTASTSEELVLATAGGSEQSNARDLPASSPCVSFVATELKREEPPAESITEVISGLHCHAFERRGGACMRSVRNTPGADMLGHR